MTSSTVDTDKQLSLLSLREGQVEFDQKQREALIDVLRVRHATDADMAVFFHQSRRVGLDPFLRQIYMIARQEWDKDAQSKVWRQTFQTGIDGFRVVAHRRALQLHTEVTYDDTLYFDSEGKQYGVWVKSTPPAVVRVTVRMGNSRYPFDARYEDYVPMVDEYEPDTWKEEKGKRVKIKGKPTGKKVPQGMWASRGTSQLEKCAEAGSLRRACPQDLSGIYEFSEMATGTDDKGRPAVDVDAVEVTVTRVDEAHSRDWVAEFDAATTPAEASALFNAAKAAGEKSATVDEAIKRAVERIQAAAAPPETDEPGQTVPDSGTAETSSEDSPPAAHNWLAEAEEIFKDESLGAPGHRADMLLSLYEEAKKVGEMNANLQRAFTARGTKLRTQQEELDAAINTDAPPSEDPTFDPDDYPPES